MKAFRLYLLLTFIVAVLRCVNPQLAGANGEGNGSETVARGVIVDSTGAPASGVAVQLLPGAYNPGADQTLSVALRTVTDTLGEYSIDSVSAGTYALEAGSFLTGVKALVKGIVITSKKTDVVLAKAKLEKTGVVFVKLAGMTPQSGDYVYLPGTSTFAVISTRDIAAGQVVLGGVPVGIFTELMYVAVADSIQVNFLSSDLTVHPGDTLALAYTTWKYSRQLVLNTTAAGAAIIGNVYDFPILVHVTGTTFDFSQAQNRGEDIRFAKSNGSPLTYEIERWDRANQQAEIWVRIDSIYGNNDSQTITMHWGNPDAANESNGAAVFDTTTGFTGVWHLDTNCSDVTAGNHGGTNFGATDIAGISGSAKKFDGNSYLQVPGLLGTPQSITISAWVRLDSTIGLGQEIISLGDAVAIRADREGTYGTAGFFCSTVSDSDTVHVAANTGVAIFNTGWRYLVYTVDSTQHVQSMYIDGTSLCSTIDNNSINYSGLGPNMVLGAHGNQKTQSYLFGCIDEARVCRIARSADWIKLCYMNQKEQDALVKW